jgi:nucleolar complex protein 3
LADALKTLLWEGKQQDMLRAAAFIKRLATFALSFGSAEAIAGLDISLPHLIIGYQGLQSILFLFEFGSIMQ